LAINKNQELCLIDFHQESKIKIILKRKIPGLEDPQKFASIHILQITPHILALGSILKTVEESSETEIIKPYFHIFSGDLSDMNSELKMKEFYLPKLKSLDQKYPIIFRSLFVKERQVLLFGHTASDKVHALYYGLDGSLTEIDMLDLGGQSLSGMTYLRKVVKGKESKPYCRVEYQNKKFWIPTPPSILILDSKENLHHFRCCDTRFAVHALSSTCRISVEEFNKREALIKTRFNSKSWGRCKSSDPKRIKDVKVRRRRDGSLTKERIFQSESILKSAGKDLWAKKIKKIMLLQNISVTPNNMIASKTPASLANLIDRAFDKEIKVENQQNCEIIKSLCKDDPMVTQPSVPVPFLNSIENLFRSNIKTEVNKSSTSTSTSNLFSNVSTKIAGPTNALFSSQNGLFGESTKKASSGLFFHTSKTQNPLLQSHKTKASRAFEGESGSGLFSFGEKSTPKEQDLISLSSSSLFSKTSESKNFLQALQEAQIVEDAIKKRARLILNKLESDVVFKVEDKEFPAHKKILSERCKFFENMFASGMMESYSSVIEINNIKASTWRAFLEFLYLGETQLKEDLALDLLKLANEYMLKSLQSICEDYLAKNLNIDNCIKISEIASLYESESLNSNVEAFFQQNAKKLVECKDFEDFPMKSYRYALEAHWNSEFILGPPFAKLISNGFYK